MLLKLSTIKEKLCRTLVKNDRKEFIKINALLYFWDKIYIPKGQRENIYNCKGFLFVLILFVYLFVLSKCSKKQRSGIMVKGKPG